MKQNAKKKKWIKFRHRIMRHLVYVAIYPFAKIKYGLKITKFKAQGKRPYLIVYNHVTAYDQFFVGMCFKGPIYYVATEDIFSNGLSSALIKYLVAPIPFKKSVADVRAVMNCKKVASEGGTICLAPEGNRSYSGRTETLKPAIAGLAKLLKMPVACVRIEDGYGVQPRWCDKLRKGNVKVSVTQVIEPEEIKELPEKELFERIRAGIYSDESKSGGTFAGKNLAEYLDRAMYVCPECGLSEFFSKGDYISCNKCGLTARYTPTKTFEGVGKEFPFKTVAEWYDHQEAFISKLDLSSLGDEPIYTDEIRISNVIVYKKKELLDKVGKMAVYKDRFEFVTGPKTTVVPFDEVTTVSVLGRNKLNVYFGDKGATLWQFKGGKHFNAVKYMHICLHYQNLKKGETEHEFFGL